MFKRLSLVGVLLLQFSRTSAKSQNAAHRNTVRPVRHTLAIFRSLIRQEGTKG